MDGGDGATSADIMSNLTGINAATICYSPYTMSKSGVWQGDNPMYFSLPTFILQTTLVVSTTRVIYFLLKPLRQPKVISEILGGIVLGPSLLGKYKLFANAVFPLRSVMVLETMANVGLVYFLFLVGLEMDIAVIRRTGKKAIVIALSGMALPFAIGASTSFFLKDDTTKIVSNSSFLLFLGVSVSVTAFPVLARILAELKLLNTEIGRIAMSSALVNDMCAWALLAVAIALAEKDINTWSSLGVIFSSVVFVVFCIYVIRPAIYWIIKRTPEGENISDLYICVILTGVMVCGFITDAIGTHSIFGAFVYGLVIPNGPIGVTLIEKLEDFVSGLLLPLFFATSGLRTNIRSIDGSSNWMLLFIVIIFSSAAKVGITLLVALFLYQMPFHEGVALGLLMNTKGLIEMIILNIGMDQKVLDEQAFATMVIVAVVTTGIITPTIINIHKTRRRFGPYKRRTIQKLKPDSELRMLACIHTPRNVPTIINLLEATHPTKRSHVCVYALHLVELTGRASAMLIVHNTRKSGRPALNRTQAQSDHIFNAFENYEQNTVGVSVYPLTVISPYSTMHEDICNLAEDKRGAFVIVPFHKQQTVDGGMEVTNPSLRDVNQNVLANAPCSVGILVDRGLGTSVRVTDTNITHHMVVLFFGGPDDREALSYAARMVEHPSISLTVLRFMPREVVDPAVHSNDSKNQSNLTVATGNENDKQTDDDFINAFRMKNMNNSSITYTEKVVDNGDETVAVIRSIDSMNDLFIVGRGHSSPLTAGLTDWSECPELGIIGDLLASSDFAATVSVLVVQQYVGIGTQGDGGLTPDSSVESMARSESIQETEYQRNNSWRP